MIKWDNCITNAPNGLIYGYSFYLDHMAKQWDALVLNDYEAVMPLTWNKKYGINLFIPAFSYSSIGSFWSKYFRGIAGSISCRLFLQNSVTGIFI